MSVGGFVIATDIYGDEMVIFVRDEHGDRLQVRSESNTEVKPGDCVWWHHPWVLWTPRDGSGREDIKLKKIGRSAGSADLRVLDPE